MAISLGSGAAIKAEPNVTPMIDVMLVLLIIFMIVAPSLLTGFPVTPPRATNLRAHPEDPGDRIIGVDRDGFYYLNKRPISREALPNALRALVAARDDDGVVYLKADRNLSYARVLDVLDVARSSGARVVGMIAEQREGRRVP